MIHFFTEDVDFFLPSEPLISSWLNNVVRAEHQQINSLSYIFCSDDYLLTINQQYLNHDFYTDVITFDHRELDTEPIEGDIFVSHDRVVDNGRQLSVSKADELNRVMLHGLLHLIGYSDETSDQKYKMRLLEDKYLANLRET